MKIIFDGFIGQLDAEKERIDEFEDIKRNFQNWNAKKKKKKNRKFRKWGTVAKGVEYTKCKYQRKERKDKNKYLK